MFACLCLCSMWFEYTNCWLHQKVMEQRNRRKRRRKTKNGKKKFVALFNEVIKGNLLQISKQFIPFYSYWSRIDDIYLCDDAHVFPIITTVFHVCEQASQHDIEWLWSKWINKQSETQEMFSRSQCQCVISLCMLIDSHQSPFDRCLDFSSLSLLRLWHRIGSLVYFLMSFLPCSFVLFFFSFVSHGWSIYWTFCMK